MVHQKGYANFDYQKCLMFGSLISATDPGEFFAICLHELKAISIFAGALCLSPNTPVPSLINVRGPQIREGFLSARSMGSTSR